MTSTTMTTAEIISQYESMQAQCERAHQRVTEAIHMFGHPQRASMIASEQSIRRIAEQNAEEFYREHRATIEAARTH